MFLLVFSQKKDVVSAAHFSKPCSPAVCSAVRHVSLFQRVWLSSLRKRTFTRRSTGALSRLQPLSVYENVFYRTGNETINTHRGAGLGINSATYHCDKRTRRLNHSKLALLSLCLSCIDGMFSFQPWGYLGNILGGCANTGVGRGMSLTSCRVHLWASRPARHISGGSGPCFFIETCHRPDPLTDCQWVQLEKKVPVEHPVSGGPDWLCTLANPPPLRGS